MSLTEIFSECDKLGLTLRVEGDRLSVSPKEKVPDYFVTILTNHKPELINWLKLYPREKREIKPQTEDVVLSTLKKRWFELATKEDFPGTPKITKELDNLTEAIRKMTAQEFAS